MAMFILGRGQARVYRTASRGEWFVAFVAKTFQDLFLLLPAWAAWPLVAVTLLVGVPTWWNVLRERQVVGALRLAFAERGLARSELLLVAYSRAGAVRRRWGALARFAVERGQADVVELALVRLRALGGGEEADSIDAKRKPPTPPVGHPEEALAAVERLVELGANEAARKRVVEARARFPKHAGLAEIEKRIGVGGAGHPVSARPGETS